MNPRLSQRGPGHFEQADYYEAAPAVNVYSWCPGEEGKGPTQVHIHAGSPPGPIIVIRMKSAEALDALIEALELHRRDVWGEP